MLASLNARNSISTPKSTSAFQLESGSRLFVPKFERQVDTIVTYDGGVSDPVGTTTNGGTCTEPQFQDTSKSQAKQNRHFPGTRSDSDLTWGFANQKCII